MLILVAVSINVLVRSDLIGATKTAADATQDSYNKEEHIEDYATVGNETLGDYLARLQNGNGGTGENPPPAPEEKELTDYIETAATSNEKVEDALGNSIVIPKDFKIVANGTDGVVYPYYGDSGVTPCVQDGIVIENATDGNQFVWIPVGGEIKNKADDSRGTTSEIKLGRYTFADDGTPTIQQTATASGAGTTTTVGTYFKELKNTETSAGFTSARHAIDIDEFCKLAIANGGYYIGRYEAAYGTGGVKALSKQSTGSGTSAPTTAGYLWNKITQPNAATKAKAMYPYSAEAKTYSDLINSFAWDTAIVFIEKYSGDTDYAHQNSINTSLGISGERTSTVDKRCNIYDMASNVYEWTTEYSTSSGYPCVERGGGYGNSNLYTGNRGGNDTTSSGGTIGFRPTLYVEQSST